ncbi:hypothetical protein TSUD_244590 [Trifolium subterraneum]|uniref:Uncharacterized protein n=1 Tax=Trifolium subterraneum TaxID=3900 RepID=A0A2Z6PIP3_TRISU|nr:hypothetical protein TSUD_244590 [Trifolium subterraneum]
MHCKLYDFYYEKLIAPVDVTSNWSWLRTLAKVWKISASREGKKYENFMTSVQIRDTYFSLRLLNLVATEEQKIATSLRVSCWLNGATCCLHLNDFLIAIKLCIQSIRILMSEFLVHP